MTAPNKKRLLPIVPVTLMGKGRLFVSTLVFYVCLAAFYLFSQKADLVSDFERYNTLSQAESALVTGGLAITEAYNDLFFIVENLDRDAIVERVHKHFQNLLTHYQSITDLFPEQANQFREVTGLLAATVNLPNSENMFALKTVLSDNKREIDQLVESNLALRTVTVQQLIERSNTLAVHTLLLSILGIIGAGSVISFFFTRMAFDLRLLSTQLKQVLEQKRGVELSVTRIDELGDVMRFSQQMGQRLEDRNAELAIERQQRLHQERRAAIDHLLAGLIHELGNPIAAVSAMVQNAAYYAKTDQERQQWDTFTPYTDRMTTVLSDLNRLSLPASENTFLININEEIGNVIKLFKYDERWQKIEVREALDANIAPLQGNPNSLQQLLTILINYCVECLTVQQGAQLTIETRSVSGIPVCQLTSNSPFGVGTETLMASEDLHWSGLSDSEFDLIMSRNLAESMGFQLSVITSESHQTLLLQCALSDQGTLESVT